MTPPDVKLGEWLRSVHANYVRTVRVKLYVIDGRVLLIRHRPFSKETPEGCELFGPVSDAIEIDKTLAEADAFFSRPRKG